MPKKTKISWFTWLTTVIIPLIALGLSCYQIIKEKNRPAKSLKASLNSGKESKNYNQEECDINQKIASLSLEELYREKKFEEAIEKLNILQAEHPFFKNKIQTEKAFAYLRWGKYLQLLAKKSFEKGRLNHSQFQKKSENACKKLEQCLQEDALKKYTQQANMLLKEWKK